MMNKEKKKHVCIAIIFVSLIVIQLAHLVISLTSGPDVASKREDIIKMIDQYFCKDELSTAEVLAAQLLSRDPGDSDAALWLEKIHERQVADRVHAIPRSTIKIIERQGNERVLTEQARLLAHLKQSIDSMKHETRNTPMVIKPVERMEAADDTFAGSFDTDALGRYLSSGIASYTAGDYLNAKVAFKKVLDADPGNTHAHAYLGAALYEENPQNEEQSKEALSHCKEALVTDKTNKLAYATLGKIHDSRGDRELAIINYLEASGIDPGDVDLLFRIGRVYFMMQDVEKADTYFAKALKLQNDMPLVFYYQALCAREQGQGKRAVALLSRALDYDKQFYSAFRERGQFYFSQCEYKNAMADFQRALALRDGFSCRVRLGDCYLKLGHADRAMQTYQSALQVFSPSGKAENQRAAELYVYLAKNLYEQDDMDGAYRFIQQAVSSSLAVPELYLMKGRIELARKETGSACETFKHVVSMDPASVEGCCALALLYKRLGRNAEADNIMKKFIARHRHLAENKLVLDTLQALHTD